MFPLSQHETSNPKKCSNRSPSSLGFPQPDGCFLDLHPSHCHLGSLVFSATSKSVPVDYPINGWTHYVQISHESCVWDWDEPAEIDHKNIMVTPVGYLTFPWVYQGHAVAGGYTLQKNWQVVDSFNVHHFHPLKDCIFSNHPKNGKKPFTIIYHVIWPDFNFFYVNPGLTTTD